MKMYDSIPDRVNAVSKHAADQCNFDVVLTKHGKWEIELTRCITFKLLTECSSVTLASKFLPVSI